MQITFSDCPRFSDGKITVNVQVLGNTSEIEIIAAHKKMIDVLQMSLEKVLNDVAQSS